MNEASYSYVVRVGDKTFNVIVRPSGEGRFRVLVEDAELDVFVETGQPVVRTQPNTDLTSSAEPRPSASKAEIPSSGNGKKSEARPAVLPQTPVPTAAPTAPAVSGAVIGSPIPGKVLKVLVNPGDVVNPGKLVATLESMKMEVEVFSDKSGKVRELRARPGEFVNVGDPLIILD